MAAENKPGQTARKEQTRNPTKNMPCLRIFLFQIILERPNKADSQINGDDKTILDRFFSSSSKPISKGTIVT
jgi:hypothetical protein